MCPGEQAVAGDSRPQRQQHHPHPTRSVEAVDRLVDERNDHRHGDRTHHRHHEHEAEGLDALASTFGQQQVGHPDEQRDDGPHVTHGEIRRLVVVGGRGQHGDDDTAHRGDGAHDFHGRQPLAHEQHGDGEGNDRRERADDQRHCHAHVLQRREERADVQSEQHAERCRPTEVGPARPALQDERDHHEHGRGHPHAPERQHHTAHTAGLAQHPAERPERRRAQHGEQPERATARRGGFSRHRGRP